MANNIPSPYSVGGSGYPANPVVSGAAAAGEFLSATSPTAASWRDLAAADIPATLNGTTFEGTTEVVGTSVLNGPVFGPVNTLDDGSGNMSIGGQVSAFLGSAAVNWDIFGTNNGSIYANFEFGDNATSEYWAFSHRSSPINHSLLFYFYNGSSFVNTMTLSPAGAITTIDNTLDDASGNMIVGGVASHNGGTNTSGTAAVSSPAFTSGTALQVNTTQDTMLYIAIQTAAALAVAIGPANTTTTSLMPSQTYALGLITIRVPKGWWVKITGTIADLTITAVTC